MSGLLVKDFRLLMQRKMFFVVILLVAAFLSFSKEDNIGFVSGYLILLVVMFCISSLSYDEYDNCYPFLLTLPITKRTYVWEKYLFGLILGVAAGMVSAAIYLVNCVAVLHRPLELEVLVGMLATVLVGLLILDFSIPLLLKFGLERGRIYMLVAVGGVVLIGMMGKRLLESRGIFLEGAMEQFLSGPWINAVGLAAVLLVTIISIGVSIKIMEKKEF